MYGRCWPNAPIYEPQLNGRSRGIAAVGTVVIAAERPLLAMRLGSSPSTSVDQPGLADLTPPVKRGVRLAVLILIFDAFRRLGRAHVGRATVAAGAKVIPLQRVA